YNERRLTLMAELDKAINQDALELYFQPQMDLASGRIMGVETLLRWVHPEHGFVPPDEFVVLAGRTGIITPLTRWVLRQALAARAPAAAGRRPTSRALAAWPLPVWPRSGTLIAPRPVCPAVPPSASGRVALGNPNVCSGALAMAE